MRETLGQKVVRLLGSRKFFYLILAFFVFEAAWIALSGVYPMAFDEDFHFGLIKLYSQHLTPFFSQSSSSYIFGQITHDPSYMYHYLMGFPYRLIEVFTKNMTDQVIALRFIDISFFTVGLVAFRRVLIRLKISNALTNAVLLFFVLTPITSLLAAQINYDNMLMLCLPFTLLLALRFIEELKVHKKFSVPFFVGWLSLSFFTSLVMYTFLPIFLAMGIYLAYVIYKEYREHKHLWKKIKDSYRLLSRWTKVGLITALLISGALFVQRDGLNTIEYGTPTPECNQVLTVADCLNFGSWERNYRIHEYKPANFKPNPVGFIQTWTHTMFYNLFFAINGINSGFFAQPPLPLPEWSALFIAVFGVALVIIYRKKVFSNYAGSFFALIIGIYTLALFAQNFSDYLHLGTAIAIDGRYLVPILLLIYALVGVGFRELLRRRDLIKPILTVVILLLFLNGGGVMTFIIRSDNSWYRSSSKVNTANEKAQKVLVPLTLGSKL